MIAFGTAVKHKYSACHGIVTARLEYSNGCVQVRLSTEILKDGEPVHVWFDEADVQIVEEATEKETEKTGGGPRDVPGYGFQS
jgi:hypothetical protein